MRYFDSLVHVTSDGRWLGADRYDASIEQLRRRLDAGSIPRACAVGIAGLTDNEAIIELTAADPDRFVPVAGFDPSDHRDRGGIISELEDFARAGFVGIKLHPRFNNYDPLDDRVLWTLEAAARLGLVVHYCMLTRQRSRPTPHPVDIADRLLTWCQDTRIVLVHAGGVHARELFELGRMHEHVILDVAFTLMRYARSTVDDDLRFLFEHLDQRTVVGSDSPEYDPVAVADRFAELTTDLCPKKRDRVAWANLEALYPGPYPMSRR